MTTEIQIAIDAAVAPLRTQIQTLEGGNAALCKRIEELEDAMPKAIKLPEGGRHGQVLTFGLTGELIWADPPTGGNA